MSPENLRKIAHSELEISTINILSVRNRLTDIQEILNYSELVNKHLRNVSKRFQKDISSRSGDIPILASFQ